MRDEISYAPASVEANPQTVVRDYENYTVGESERNAHVGNKGEGTALVTDETAAAGKHSLKFTDAAGLGANFFPYITYPLELGNGSLKMSFNLRWEAGALVALDWRDDPYNYNMGPNLTTTGDGWLLANGKYDLTLTLPNTAPQVFKDTACSPKFELLNCVVFMSLAETPTMFYVENLEPSSKLSHPR